MISFYGGQTHLYVFLDMLCVCIHSCVHVPIYKWNYRYRLSGFRRPVCFRAKKHPEYCLAVVNILYKYSKYLYNIVNILYKYSKYSYKYSKYSYKYSKYSYKYSKYSYKYSKYSYKYFKRNVLSILGDILHLLELFVAVC